MRTDVAAIVVIVVAAALVATVVIVARRTGPLPAGEVVVRCRAGHLFTTIWIPGASLKAIRLGWIRLQYCPVGRHWTLVTPVPPGQLTDRERRIAARYHDARIP